jgi:hypothetical protein
MSAQYPGGLMVPNDGREPALLPAETCGQMWRSQVQSAAKEQEDIRQ